MLITSNNICHYLIAQGLVTSESVVDGDFAVMDVSGRNRNFKVSRGAKSGYFLKQIQNWDVQTIAMLQCEAACYWLVNSNSGFESMAGLLPQFCWFDAERHILITSLILNSENLSELFRRVDAFPVNVAGQLGQILGIYHRDSLSALEKTEHTSIFPRQLPWILLEERRNSHPFKELSPATAKLFDAVDQSDHLRNTLAQLREDWHADALIHGDMRLENCVLSDDKRTNEFNIKIVDWELADIGDASWDVGGIIQAFLSASIMSAANPLNGQERLSKDGTLRAIQSLWKEYANTRDFSPQKSETLRERSIKYGCARMIQSSYEYVQLAPDVSPAAHNLFQISSEMLRRPAEAVRQIFETESN